MAAPKAIENDALIESSFRRLLAAIESEREKIRVTWREIEDERENTAQELERLRQETMEWCTRERQKVVAEKERLQELSRSMSVFWEEGESELLEINCSGHQFSLPKNALCGIPGSLLNHMFSDEFITQLPRDMKGRFLLDFNPICFGLVVDYLQNRRLRDDAPVPTIPLEQQQNMDLLAEALRLKPFLRENRINPMHQTSLLVTPNTIESTIKGWQVITAKHPLSMARGSYFEVTILKNEDPKGGLAIGVCNHVPTETEIHSIRLAGSVVYNSNNGLIGDAFGADDVTKGVQFAEGTTVGVKWDVPARALVWYVNRLPVGSCTFKAEMVEKMRVLFPVFGLYVPKTKISVEFDSSSPSGSKGPPLPLP